MRILGMSLLVAIIATVIDQVFHVAAEAPHSVLTLLVPSLAVETAAYIGVKFALVFIISAIVLFYKDIFGKKSLTADLEASLVIALMSAGLFGIIMTYYFPLVYSPLWHMAHAFGIFVGAILVIKYVED